jgi:hypothetical protein
MGRGRLLLHVYYHTHPYPAHGSDDLDAAGGPRYVQRPDVLQTEREQGVRQDRANFFRRDMYYTEFTENMLHSYLLRS